MRRIAVVIEDPEVKPAQFGHLKAKGAASQPLKCSWLGAVSSYDVQYAMAAKYRKVLGEPGYRILLPAEAVAHHCHGNPPSRLLVPPSFHLS